MLKSSKESNSTIHFKEQTKIFIFKGRTIAGNIKTMQLINAF